MGLEELLQVGHVRVAKDQPGGLGEAEAVDDAGVVQLVGEDHVPLLEEGPQHPLVGGEARLEDEGAFRPLEAGQGLLQLHVVGEGAGDGAHRPASRPHFSRYWRAFSLR